MSYFEVFAGKNDQYYFRLKAGNHEPVLVSEGYASKSGCQNGIESVKRNAPNDAHYVRREGPSFSFTLKAANGEPIGRSETYSSASARDHGIEAVKRAAAEATVKDLTLA